MNSLMVITLTLVLSFADTYKKSFTDISTIPGPSEISRDDTEILLDSNKINLTTAEDFINMTLLQNVDLMSNKITVFPNFSYVGDILKKVSLGYNQISFLPISRLRLLTAMEELALQYNSLSQVPDVSSNYNLKIVLYQGNTLNQFPTFLVFGQNVEHMTLSFNQMKSLPPKYTMFQHRTSNSKLDLVSSFNPSLISIPPLRTSNIEEIEINLSGTKLTCDSGFAWLLYAHNATIQGTCFMPAGLNMEPVADLTLAALGVATVPPAPYKRTNQNLQTVPTDIPTSTLVLDLSHNSIQTIRQSDLTNTPSLNELWLWDNQIEEFPDLSSVTNLKLLDLSDNRLSAIPNDLLNTFTQLEVLNLDGNRLSYIPNVAGPGNTLRELHLCNNSFNTFPTLNQLGASLNYLYINNNAIKSFPPENFLFGHGSTIKFLQIDVGSNQLTSIPPILNEDYPDKLTLYLYDNPLVCDADLAWLLTYSKPKYIDGNCAGPTALLSRNLAQLELMDLKHPQGEALPRTNQLLCKNLPTQSYKLLLPLIKYTSITWTECVFACLNNPGCVYINYKASGDVGESNCHYAAPFDGAIYNTKHDNGIGWTYHAIV